jgi:hypothetical protein
VYGVSIGPWLSLVERSLGVGEVAGSNPVGPIFIWLLFFIEYPAAGAFINLAYVFRTCYTAFAIESNVSFPFGEAHDKYPTGLYEAGCLKCIVCGLILYLCLYVLPRYTSFGYVVLSTHLNKIIQAS